MKKKFKVTLIFKYKDVVEVEAENEEEAEELAMDKSNEQFWCHEDTIIEEL